MVGSATGVRTVVALADAGAEKTADYDNEEDEKERTT